MRVELDEEMRPLLKEVIMSRCPESSWFLHTENPEKISDDEVEELCHRICDELLATGFTRTGFFSEEINKRGIVLERLIDYVNQFRLFRGELDDSSAS